MCIQTGRYVCIHVYLGACDACKNTVYLRKIRKI